MQTVNTGSETGLGTFRDRDHAGRLLARELAACELEAPLVLAIPRGGIPVAAVVARQLGAELDVLMVRKLAVPGHEELALGAMACGAPPSLNPRVVESFGITKVSLDRLVAHEKAELERRERDLRGERPRSSVAGRNVVVVDDGVVTGVTMRAAIAAVRAQGARRIVVAVPVAPRETVAALQHEADTVICPLQSDHVFMLGQFFEDFSRLGADFARRLLARARAPVEPAMTIELPIQAGEARLAGTLSVPQGAVGVVAFAHGSGSGRFSPRNRHVAEALQEAGFATLLVDLLTAEEEAIDNQTSELRFDIELLSKRTIGVIDWLEREPRTAGLRLGLFGASTGAAAALIAAAARPRRVDAVVSRGGRPDLAEASLSRVQAPTLLIVGSADHAVLELNRVAAARLRCVNQLEVVSGATHLFEEPGKLDEVAALAIGFLREHLLVTPAPDALPAARLGPNGATNSETETS